MKKEYGRSMVEMLGTLAIIGVLSVTALVGYKIAMTKNRTNNILYDVNLAMNEIATREYMSLPVDEEAPVSDLGVKSEFDIGYARLGGEEKNGFYIAVSNITEEVCETLLSNKTAFMISIQPNNDETALTSCTGANAVLMKFPYPPIEGGEVVETVPPVTCDSDEYFTGLSCRSCPSGATCNGTNAICSDTSKYFDGWGCYSCPSDATCSGTRHVNCSDTSKYFYAPWGSCESCPADATCDGTENVICSDTSKYFHGGSCRSCPDNATCDGIKILECGDGYVFHSYNNNTYCCSTSQYFNDASCFSCPSGATCDGTKITDCGSGKVLNTYSTCNKCCSTSQYFKDGWCKSCPTNAVCNGTDTVTCTSGTWNGSKCS